MSGKWVYDPLDPDYVNYKIDVQENKGPWFEWCCSECGAMGEGEYVPDWCDVCQELLNEES